MTLPKTADPDSNHPSAAESVESQIERLNQLLLQPECPVMAKDATFSSHGHADRRTDRRRPFLTEVLAVQLSRESGDRSFRIVRGHSLNFSPNGIGFVLPEPIEDEQLILLIDHPDFEFPNCYFSAIPLRVEQVEDRSWEYGAILRPLFGGTGVDQFDRSLFEHA